MRESLESQALTIAHMLRNRLGERHERHGWLLDYGLRLLAHVLRQIIEGADGLARAARTFPAAKRLVAGPGSSGRSLGAVRVGHSRLGVLLEPGDLIRAAIEAGREAEHRTVHELHRFLVRGHPVHHDDGQKHLLVPQRVSERRLCNRRTYEETPRKSAFLELLTAGEQLCAAIAQLRDIACVVLVSALRRHGTKPVLASARIADAQLTDLAQQLVEQGRGHLAMDIETRERRTLLPAHTEGRAHDAVRGTLDIGGGCDDAGILPAHFGDARPR